MKKKSLQIVIALLFAYNINAQNFIKSEQSIFSEKVKTNISLFVDSKIFVDTNCVTHKFIYFKTKLQVNTDGTPISYHPFDLKGETKAINNIGNAVVITKINSKENLFLSHYSEAISVFEKFRDTNYEVVPNGFTITWNNVLIPEKINGIEKPCVIKSGQFAGYYVSATSLKNGLTENLGDCACNNQVNPLNINAFVLPKGNNILKKYGASIGDLLVAYNPKNDSLQFAIINDEGPKDKLGEGSILLNMKLLGKSDYPKTKRETYKLATSNEIIILLFPNSKNFNKKLPYSMDNINTRTLLILKEYGLDRREDIINFIKSR